MIAKEDMQETLQDNLMQIGKDMVKDIQQV